MPDGTATSTVSAPSTQSVRELEGRNRPSSSSRRGPYEWTLITVSVIFAAICIWFVGAIIWQSIPAFKQQGWYMIFGTTWQSGADTGLVSQYGGRNMIIGTIETSLIALVIAVLVGTGTSLAINFFLPSWMKTFTATVVELLAAVPSVVYGIWGLLVLAPIMNSTVGPWLTSLPGGQVIFGEVVQGPSILLAGIVLSVMVLPTYVAISREVLGSVPHELTEASLSLGATKWQTLWKTVIPTARIGLFGAISLALGRAIGETVAVALVAGQLNSTDYKLLRPGSSLASWIANQFGEATGDQVNALFALGLILMVMSLGMSIVASRMVARQRRAAAVV